MSRERLEHELMRRGWSAQDLAAAAGLSAATVSAARRGHRVHARTLRLMAIALQKTPVVEGVEALLGEAPPQP